MSTASLTAINPHLTERRIAYLTDAVTKLEAAVASGIVPNKLFTDAKDTLNRAVEESAEAFLKTGPHAQQHHQSDWWLGAYHNAAFARGTHTLPTVLKRAEKNGLNEYAAFITALLPLRDLLETAKPLVKKKGELPVVKTAKQIADEADQMTCQCCGRGIFAATGLIAHHGYERPGDGYQTASCFGARALPWEVSRKCLGELITMLKGTIKNLKTARADIEAEAVECSMSYSGQRDRETHTLRFSRNTFKQCQVEFPEAFKSKPNMTFDQCKARNIENLTDRIARTTDDLKACQARFDGWKQTHERIGGKWAAL